MELDTSRTHQPRLQSPVCTKPEHTQASRPQYPRHFQPRVDVTGRASASERYRRGSHHGLPYFRKLSVVMLCLLLTTAAGAQSPPECVLSAHILAEDNREFPAVQRADGALSCMPANTTLGREVHQRFAALEPSHAFETRGTLPPNGATTADLYKELHAISTLRGIRYFSILHRGQRVLFKTAHAIDDQGAITTDPIPPASGHSVAYALVNDASFGKAPYRLEYRTKDNSILLIVSNLLPLSVLRINLIASDRLLIALLITPRDPAETGPPDPASNASDKPWTLHGLVAAQAPRGSFLDGFVEASLRSRLAALQDWIVARATAIARPESNTSSEARAGDNAAAQH